MQNDFRYLTSESVTEGHPDKVCDQIADAVLDALLRDDPDCRSACEVCTTTGLVLVMGEITTSAYADIPQIARDVITRIGYHNGYGFNADTCAVLTSIHEQSPDIARGVDQAFEARSGKSDLTLGAGDQGMVIGYACNETAEYMPLPLTLANKICKQLATVRKSGEAKYLEPDGKAQVTVAYKDGKPQFIDTLVLSTQHKEEASLKEVIEEVHKLVLDPILPRDMLTADTKYYINPTGRFVIGGPQGDSGLTGRKLIVDTYGGFARHGGGAFSGKDPTKIDRSASYAARYVAKNLVAAGLADRVEIEIDYAIGMAEPVAIDVHSFGTGKISDRKMVEIIRDNFDLRPQAIIENLDLRRPIYEPLAAYGHFGRPDLDLSWEKLDKLNVLKEAAGLS